MKLYIIFILIIIIIFIIKKKAEKSRMTKKRNHFNDSQNKNFINTIVNHSYVINMDKDHKRLEVFTKYMNALNIPFERIKGVDGKHVYEKYKDKTQLTPGELGCLLSHINIMKDAIEKGYENIMVFEDDAIFNKDFHNIFYNTYKSILDKEKEFDLLYLGYNDQFYKTPEFKKYGVDDRGDYYIPKRTHGIFGVIINKNIFSEILKHYETLEKHSDVVLIDYIQPFFKCFNLKIPIVSVNNKVNSNTEKVDISDWLFFLPKINVGIKLSQNWYKINNVDLKEFVDWW